MTESFAVFPLPDTRTASPGTEISFRGASPKALGRLTVTGSASGAHSGIFVPHSDGQGVSFVPDAPFRAGETVTVQAGAPLGAAGGKSYSFETVRPVTPTRVAARDDDPGIEPLQFRSRPDLRPLPIEVTTPASKTAPGLIFIGPRFKNGQSGPLILNDTGEPVWFLPLGGKVIQANAVRVQQYRGEPVVTWCEGPIGSGHGFGHFVICDGSYQSVATFQVGNGFAGGDIHEFTISPDGTALVTIYNRVRWDLSAIGGAVEDLAMDSIAQEIDIPTGRVLFEWHSLDHVGLDETILNVPGGELDTLDHFHLNSIDVDDDDNLVMNARHTCATYKVDRRTGEIIWRLNGTQSSFAMGDGAGFNYQHDARVHPGGRLSLFDNASVSNAEGIPSRAIALQLDTEAMTATLEQAIIHPTGIVSVSQGNTQLLDNGNVFVGWGSAPVFSEFDGNGDLIFNARFPPSVSSYRAHRFPWVGTPKDRPAIAVETGAGNDLTVYVSWNGATEVATWRVLAGPRPDELREIASAPRSGFETAIPVQTAEPYIAIQAEDGSGNVLRASKTVKR